MLMASFPGHPSVRTGVAHPPDFRLARLQLVAIGHVGPLSPRAIAARGAAKTSKDLHT